VKLHLSDDSGIHSSQKAKKRRREHGRKSLIRPWRALKNTSFPDRMRPRTSVIQCANIRGGGLRRQFSFWLENHPGNAQKRYKCPRELPLAENRTADHYYARRKKKKRLILGPMSIAGRGRFIIPKGKWEPGPEY